MFCLSSNPLSNSDRLGWTGIATATILAAFILRLPGLGTESAWIDEGFSIALAEHSIPEIIQGTAADQHPPFYYLLLHFWMVPGAGVFYARFFSLLLGVLHIAQIIQLGRRLGKSEIGLGAALLLVVSPMHIWYSQEARMYMLETVLTTAATSELWLCLHGKNRWALYGALSLLAIYTHYLAIFVVIAHTVWVLVWILLKQQLQNVPKWLSAILVMTIGFSLWIPTMLTQAQFHKMEWLRPPDAYNIRDALIELLVGNEALQMSSEVRWLVVSLLGLIVLLGLRSGLSPSQMAWRFGFLALWAILPFAVITAISLFYPVFQTKQFLMLVGPLTLLIVHISRTLPRLVEVLLFIMLLATSCISFFRQESALTKDDWRGAGAYIQQRLSTGDLVYGNTAASLLPLSLYLNTRFQYDGYPPEFDIVTGGWKGEKVTPESAGQIMRVATRGYNQLWLVEYHPTFWDPKGALSDWLSQYAYLADDRQFKNIRVRFYRLQ